jgi:hypothetical protein
MLDVLECVRAHDGVEGIVAERQLLEVPTRPQDVGMRAAKPRGNGHVTADYVVVGCELLADVAGAARDVQDGPAAYRSQDAVERLGCEVGGALVELRMEALVEGGELGAREIKALSLSSTMSTRTHPHHRQREEQPPVAQGSVD